MAEQITEERRQQTPLAGAAGGGTAGDREDNGRARRRRRRKLLVLFGLLALLALAVLAFGYYVSTRKPLTALPPVLGRTTPPIYTMSIYGVIQPMAVALSPDYQRLYVTEGGGERLVRVFESSGRPIGALAPAPAPAGLRDPFAAAVDPAGQIYVAQQGTLAAVAIYDPDGSFTGMMPRPGGDRPFLPVGISFDRAGQMYVTDAADRGDHRVLVYDAARQLKLTFGKTGSKPGELLFPFQAVAHPAGRIFVSNSNNNRVDVFSPDGTYLQGFGGEKGGLGLPRGLALDDQDRLHVVDTVNQYVAVFDVSDATPKSLFTFGTEGIGDGQFRFPNAIAVDGTGHAYVADRANNRVQVWAY